MLKIIVCAHTELVWLICFSANPKTIVVEVNAQTLEDKKMGAGHYPFFDTICRVFRFKSTENSK